MRNFKTGWETALVEAALVIARTQNRVADVQRKLAGDAETFARDMRNLDTSKHLLARPVWPFASQPRSEGHLTAPPGANLF